MITIAILTGLGLWGITKATEDPVPLSEAGAKTAKSPPSGTPTLMTAVQAQDAREEGFVGRAFNRIGNSVYAWNQNVLDPGKVSITDLTKFKTDISLDHSAFTYNNIRGLFDHDYHRPIPPRSGTHVPLIGVTHAGAEIKAGQNELGNLKLFGSNPYTFYENGSSDSTIKNNQGFVLAQTYGQSQIPFDPNGETRMSWEGLRNPWRLSGVQQRMHSSYLPADKDQLTGSTPIAHPNSIYDVGGYPTKVTAPPMMQRKATVFNRNVRMGKNH